ncbi:family 20 glycosylhydrolase [Mucilaginibacter sp. UR6-11]|uniref:family 20 glycosylhydrolase n=1 Tax=Mucilaginibacter sp. UR6-11 TaxID=1435644 RepID=UPI001E436291|nr:family 20 glycosylhydrolase [Mucilaginibacter sp. UR6-11]MCC8424901.1 carbohydate-binding domain-containing protein [Mucilaginibacter sp. UR6-11]
MKYLLPALLFYITIATTVSAQKKTIDATANGINLKWETIENNYNNKPQAHAALTFSMQKGTWLPAKGWKIYFNFDEPLVPESITGNIEVTHVNGDLYYFSPNSNFTGIKASDSLRIEMVALNWLTNVSDTPQGFYLVWDKAPGKAYALKTPFLIPSTQSKQLNRTPTDLVAASNPALLFEQNKTIRNISADSLVKIFPTPDSYEPINSTFKLDGGANIIANSLFKNEAALLRTGLAKLLITTTAVKDPNRKIKLIYKVMPAEAYELSVDNNAVTISASSGAGIFYGIQSFKTLLPAAAWRRPQKIILLPGLNVADKPRFSYRAVMLDVARNFQPKKEILKLLDVMALYKLNVLHFHLTDDEGWRLEIPALPQLTAVGGKRGHSINEHQNLQPSLGSGPSVRNTSGTGFYSKADFIAILKYATQRHITVIPEIEGPGHARAAIKAMDARYNFYVSQNKPQLATQYLLRDLKDSSKYSSVQYYTDNVIDVSLPSTYLFIETVTTQLQQMYSEAGAPLKTIHYGGDEVPAGVWEKSPAFFSLMRADTTIKSTDDLWVYYYGKVNKILQDHHLYLTAWEEVGTKKVMQNGKKISVITPAPANQNIHLEVWNNVLGWGSEDLAYKLANNGYKVILSPVTNLYFDMAYNKAFDEPGYYWGGYADVDRPFSFIPYDYFKNTTKGRMGETLNPVAFAAKERLTATGIANIIGLQGALWAETLKSPQRMEYMLLPKLLGLAERAWAKNPHWAVETDTLKSKALYQQAWSNFVNVLGKHELPRLNYYAGGFNYRIPSPGAIVENGQVVVNTQLPGLKIHYTTDGTEPSANSQVYTGPIKNKGIIKLAIFDSTGRQGKTSTINN